MKRPGAPSLGAFETTATAPRPADGTFTVPEGKGLTSVGVFEANGRLVTLSLSDAAGHARRASLLAAGPFRHWSADCRGEYQVRLVKGDLNWKYQGWFANTGTQRACRFRGAVRPHWSGVRQCWSLLCGRRTLRYLREPACGGCGDGTMGMDAVG